MNTFVDNTIRTNCGCLEVFRICPDLLEILFDNNRFFSFFFNFSFFRNDFFCRSLGYFFSFFRMYSTNT